MMRLKAIQRALESHNTTNLRELELKLQMEMKEILDLRETLLKQNSRSDWLTKGDKNIEYFHSKTTAKRRRKLNRSSQRMVFWWCILKEKVKQFFNALSAEEGSEVGRLRIRECFFDFKGRRGPYAYFQCNKWRNKDNSKIS